MHIFIAMNISHGYRYSRKAPRISPFYMWGAGGKWENGVEELRERNLITEQ